MNNVNARISEERFLKRYMAFPTIGLSLDLSRVNYPDDYFQRMDAPMRKAFDAMDRLEAGAIANPDENRRVGHYWLRQPDLAPEPDLRRAIIETLGAIKAFAADVHSGKIRGANGRFRHLLIIGIGGSALGPQFVAHALGHPTTDKLRSHFFDNTDPDGMERVLAGIGSELGQTLCLVISKSGGTKETRNGMLEAQSAYQLKRLNFNDHVVAVTGVGSELDRFAVKNQWLRRFPMWDWVGGRTSVTSAVGLLPAALQGLDIDEFLRGAKECDLVTRKHDIESNPAAQLAMMWFFIGNGCGSKAMVVLPYKDRLELLSRYLQQLVMESLGKELDLNGAKVNQGLVVYGNKGSTDQHAYIQQLRDGSNNFFALFVEVLRDQSGTSIQVDPSITSGDYLHGFLLGTRQALFDNGRESITITIPDVSAYSVGVAIALFERSVGLYASLINVNAYHQPGVEAGKKAAERIVEIKRTVLDRLKTLPNQPISFQQLRKLIPMDVEPDIYFKVCQHLAANCRGLRTVSGHSPTDLVVEPLKS